MPNETLDISSTTAETSAPIGDFAPEEPSIENETTAIRLYPESNPLQQFSEEILHGSLAPEIAQQIEQIKSAKSSETHQQSQQTAELASELTNGTLSKWIKAGNLVPPSVADQIEAELISALEQRVAERIKTPKGRADALVKDTRDFLEKSNPTKDEIAAIAARLDLPTAGLKKLLPGHSARTKKELYDRAEIFLRQHLRQDTKDYALGRVQVLLFQATKHGNYHLDQALEDIFYAFNPARADSHKSLTGPNFVKNLEHYVQKADKAQKDKAAIWLEKVTEPEELISLIARGTISPNEVVAALKETEYKGKSLDLRPAFKTYIQSEWLACKNRLPEPSLVGLSYKDDDVREVLACMDDISALARLCGIHIETEKGDRQDLVPRIREYQELFFSRVDTPNSLYWHFSRKGMDILEEGELQSGDMVGDKNTGDWSKGVHFIKPGYGIETSIQYHQYAAGDMTNIGQRINNPFGVAIIYRLGDLVSSTPYRAEPLSGVHRGKANTSEDVTFRSEKGNSDYFYSLDDAYILPFADWEQLNTWRGRGRFDEILNTPSSPDRNNFRLAYNIAAKTLKGQGRSEEWIKQHLLPTADIIDPRMTHHSFTQEGRAAFFWGVSSAIQRRLPVNKDIIVPVTASPGLLELQGGGANTHRGEAWKEKLVTLTVQ